MHSDNIYFTPNTSFGATDNQEDIADHSIPSNGDVTTNTHVNNVCVVLYTIIARVNQILAITDESEFDETPKAYKKGQALFLRAYSYFKLEQLFGSVPIMNIEPLIEPIEDIFAYISKPNTLPTL